VAAVTGYFEVLAGQACGDDGLEFFAGHEGSCLLSFDQCLIL
jgi:hypothetical protein